jgi:hypothetical protein
LVPGRSNHLPLTTRQFGRLFKEAAKAAGLSCRNRHCPKCQGAASRRWLAEREAEQLPVPYFHVVYTLPSELRDIAYQNKRVVYDLLMKAAAETTLAIATDPKRLGARIGITAVLHTWGSALTHHPHVHMIVPGGGLSLDNARWIASRSNFLMHVNVLARLFRDKILAMLMDAHNAGQLIFFNTHAGLADKSAFKRFIAPLRRIKWVVYCKAPFAGPEQVLCYLSRYTHRVAISNRRLVAADDTGIAFRWKDYRINGPGRWKTMRLHPHEFIRRFLLHVLPKGFHRIRHYGLFASANRAESIATARALLDVAPPAVDPQQRPDVTPDAPRVLPNSSDEFAPPQGFPRDGMRQHTTTRPGKQGSGGHRASTVDPRVVSARPPAPMIA